jgi:hypothetical protein
VSIFAGFYQKKISKKSKAERKGTVSTHLHIHRGCSVGVARFLCLVVLRSGIAELGPIARDMEMLNCENPEFCFFASCKWLLKAENLWLQDVRAFPNQDFCSLQAHSSQLPLGVLPLSGFLWLSPADSVTVEPLPPWRVLWADTKLRVSTWLTERAAAGQSMPITASFQRIQNAFSRLIGN